MLCKLLANIKLIKARTNNADKDPDKTSLIETVLRCSKTVHKSCEGISERTLSNMLHVLVELLDSKRVKRLQYTEIILGR